MAGFIDSEEGEYEDAVNRTGKFVRQQFGRELTDFGSQSELTKFLRRKGQEAAAKLFEGKKGRAWEKVEDKKKAIKVGEAKEKAERKTGRGSWMDMKKEVFETGKIGELRSNDRYAVRVIKRGKYTSTVVDDMQTGKRLKAGSRRERDVLLSML